ncbi:hypothetical protein N9N28_15285 [Rubripirellula amarantea]|nr:hypothetical protein [Rubripirellula amarantea]
MTFPSEDRSKDYVREVLTLIESRSFDDLVRRRDQFRSQDDHHVIAAKAVDEVRCESIAALAAIRESFWEQEAVTQSSELSRLAHSKFADIAAAATRLQQVAKNRAELISAWSDTNMHQAFRLSLRKIVIASVPEANRERETVFSHIRPNHNPHYAVAHAEIQKAIGILQARYPQVFEQEKIWFSEVRHYQPKWDLASDEARGALGIALMVIIFAMLFTSWQVVISLFDL